MLASDTLAMGPFTDEFEVQIAALAGRRHAVAVSNGTAGLHLAVRGLGISPEEEAVTTPFSFVASANCVLFEGARPVFADIEEETLGLDPEAAERAIGPATSRAAAGGCVRQSVPHHGARVARAHLGPRPIEDSCEALGSRLNGRPLGSSGDVSVFAFYPNKADYNRRGGMVATDDDDLAGRARSMRNQGRKEMGHGRGTSSSDSTIASTSSSAAFGVAKPAAAWRNLKAGRDRVFAAYRGAPWQPGSTSLANRGRGRAEVDWFVYVIRLDARIDRDRLIGHLDAEGVPGRPYFSPIHLQPFYRERFDTRPATSRSPSGSRPARWRSPSPRAWRTSTSTASARCWWTRYSNRAWHERPRVPLP